MKSILLTFFLLCTPLAAMQKKSDIIDIADMDKKAVLKALFAAARPQELGLSHYHQDDTISDEEIEEIFRHGYIELIKNRIMEIRFTRDTTRLDVRSFNRYNGEGAAQRAIRRLRGNKALM